MDCKNCSTFLSDKDKFCNHCGAKVILNRITFRNIFEDFSAQFLNYDNKFLQTFIALFKKPEDVIGTYLQGTRKKYVNVISYFAIAITISGLQLYVLNKYFPEVMDLSAVTAAGSEEFSKQNLDFVNEYQAIIMMMLVPLYALMAQLVFLKVRKYNYSEHLVMFMYISSQTTILSALVTLIAGVIGLSLGTISIITLPLQILFSAYCLKRLYTLSLGGIILRTLLFLFLLGVVFVLVSVVTGIIMYYTGSMDEFIESNKPIKAVSYIASSAINWTS